MESIFNVVLITSLYGTVVGIVLILIKSLLKNRLSPKWHYLIWIVLIVKLLIPFGPESTVSLFNIIPVTYDINGIENSAEIHNERSILFSTENEISSTENYEIPTKQNFNNNTVGNTDIKKFNVKNTIAFIWFFGALLMLFWLVYTYLSFYKKLQKETYDVDQRIITIFEKCKKRIGVKGKLCLAVSNTVNTPSLFRVIKSKIILPPETAKLSDKEIEYVLLHELAHYKRKDILIYLLLLGFQVVHWFNPVMWYCFKCIRQDMEAATDESVLSILEHTEHKDYGRALIAILENFTRPLLAPGLLGMVKDRKSMERRIRMIKMAEIFKRKRNISIIVGIACILVLGGVLLTNRISAEIKDENNNVNKNIDSTNNVGEQNIQEDTQKLKSVEEAISQAIKAQGKSYKTGEFLTEGHIILDKEEKDGEVKVYTICSVGWFGFENGIFTKISGSGAIPKVMTFAVSENGEFSLVEYKRPLDGEDYVESIYEMFPEKLHDVVLSAHDKYPDILKQQEEQAENYLKSIGRKADVDSKYVDKTQVDIDYEARGILFAIYNKFDVFLNTCPDWIGSSEHIEDGIRYIYETLQGKTDDGYDLITFKNTKEDGTLIEERKYKIVGSSVYLEDYTSESEKKVNLPKEDKIKAFDVISKYFYAFGQSDFDKMRSLSTDRHNEEYMHDGDVWGIKWPLAKEIKMVGDAEEFKSESLKPIIAFDVSAYIQPVETSVLYPSTEASCYS
jgi:bla regulator protein BlaR1